MSCHGCDELAEAFARATAGCGRCAYAPALNFGPFECGAYRDGKSIVYQELCTDCIEDLKIRERYTNEYVHRGDAAWRQWTPKELAP